MGDVSELQAVIAKAMRVVPEDDGRISEFERGEEKLKRSERLTRSGCRVPDDVRRAIIAGNVEHRHATQALMAWYTNTQRTAAFVMSGTTGCGKTVAIATLAAQWDTLYLGADDVNRIFSANFGEQLAKQERIRDTNALLVLDDVGTEIDGARMLPTLLEIINARASATFTPTVIATNLTKKAFAERYPNERLLSRMARVQWTTVQGEDLRRQK
jgi:DNA replication protein DnaC